MYKASKETDIDPTEVRRLLDYDPETGIFRWKVREPGTPGYYKAWNTKWAGKLAGHKITATKGHLRGNQGYGVIGIFDRPCLQHRVAWCWMYGYWPPDQVDHINMVRDDNRIANLRLATNAQNTINRLAQDNNSSGLRGVRLHKASGLWHARITYDGTEHSLGYWKTPEDASRCYGVVSRLLHKEFSRELADQDLDPS